MLNSILLSSNAAAAVAWLICICYLQHINGVLGIEICTNDSTTNWKISKENYPELIKLFQNRTHGELDHGSHTIKFINWQDRVLRLVCLDTDINGNVKEWKHNYYSYPKNKKTDEKSEKFNKANYKSWQLVTETPIPFEYFATYSCLTIDDCWHHFYVVIKPLPKTTFPIHIETGEDGSFSCWSRSRILDDDEEEFLVNSPLQNITWKFPNGETEIPGNIQINIENKTLNDITSLWSSTITITKTTELNSGIHECIIIDKFGVSSSPDILEGVHLSSGERYRGIAHVHVRPLSYSLIPLGIIGIQILIIPLLVRFCPTAKDEADLEEEDDPKKLIRKKLNSSGGGDDEDSDDLENDKLK